MVTKSILLIEPEANLREVLYAYLHEIGGWKVVSSDSIQKGIALCMDIHPDLILLDTSTPEVDALLFTEQLKQHSVVCSIPILLITARASWFTTEQLHEMGFAGATAKPFNASRLLEQMNILLNQDD